MARSLDANTKKTLYAVSLAFVTAAFWNFVPMWLLKDAISEALRALWIWCVFPLSIPIFYAFFDRILGRNKVAE